MTSHVVLRDFVPAPLGEQLDAHMLPNDMVDYKAYDRLVGRLLQTLARKTHWAPVATKYRVSHGGTKRTSNSTDAANFHRDVNVVEGAPTPYIFTLVVYMDDATLEVIPNSCYVFDEAALEPPTKINFRRGDAILFNACTMHRGVFEGRDPTVSRKCIQVFEICRTARERDRYKDVFLTIPDAGQASLEYVSQRWFNFPLVRAYGRAKSAYVTVKELPLREDGYRYVAPESQRARALQDVDRGNLFRMLTATNDAPNPREEYGKLFRDPVVYGVLRDAWCGIACMGAAVAVASLGWSAWRRRQRP